jgi:hypothetical protein
MAARRLLSWLLSALLLFVLGSGYALPALHFAAVAHEVCAEHGALEHVHEVRGAASAEPSKDAAWATSESTHEHDCCRVLGVSPPSVLATTGALAVEVTLGLAPAAALCEAFANANVALLRYAPKLAPPV